MPEGFLPEVNIFPSQYYSEGWKYGPPRGIMIHAGTHYTDYGASCHFVIDPDGNVEQQVSLMNRSWHAYEASDYYFSIFHFAEEVTSPQLKISSLIAAKIIAFTKETWNMKIPVIRAPGPGFSPGFKEHRDGIGANWNPKLHTDGLTTVWSWQQYLDSVKLELEEDDMALFENKEDFRRETLKAIVGSTSTGDPRIEAEQLVESLIFIAGISLRMKGGDRPTKSDATQKGWDFANHIMTIDPEMMALELPSGKLSGTISFSSS